MPAGPMRRWSLPRAATCILSLSAPPTRIMASRGSRPGLARDAKYSVIPALTAALTAAYRRTVDHIMTTQYGPDWATRGDLPDEAYTTELIFSQWLSDLLDHIDAVSAPGPQVGTR